MLAAVLALRPVASQDSKDYVMEASAVSGPFGGACELCGELLCVPHLNFASASAEQYVYAEFSCHGVALNVNTADESAYVGNWDSLKTMPENASELALLKRGAVYRAFANRIEQAFFYHPSGFVPCNGTKPTAAEPEFSTQWASRNGAPLDSAVRPFEGSGGGARRSQFGSLEPSTFAVATTTTAAI